MYDDGNVKVKRNGDEITLEITDDDGNSVTLNAEMANAFRRAMSDHRIANLFAAVESFRLLEDLLPFAEGRDECATIVDQYSLAKLDVARWLESLDEAGHYKPADEELVPLGPMN